MCNVYRKPGEILDDFNLFQEEFGSFIRLVKNINRSSYKVTMRGDSFVYLKNCTMPSQGKVKILRGKIISTCCSH